MVNEFICSIHLINLPQSIQGLTLCNRKVVVKSLGNIGDYKNSPVFWGFTIMTAIHEFGHFSQRFTKTNDAEWFEHKTPRNELMQKSEAGSIFISLIFGYEPEELNEEASNFVLDLSNWKSSHEDFKGRFKTINQILTKKTVGGRTVSIRLKGTQNRTPIKVIKLGGCRFSYSRSRKHEK